MMRVARLTKHRYWVMEYPDCDLYADVPQIVDGFDSVEDERAKGKKIRTVLESGFYSSNVIDGHAVLIYDSVENKPLITGPEHRVTYEELSDEHEDEQWTDLKAQEANDQVKRNAVLCGRLEQLLESLADQKEPTHMRGGA